MGFNFWKIYFTLFSHCFSKQLDWSPWDIKLDAMWKLLTHETQSQKRKKGVFSYYFFGLCSVYFIILLDNFFNHKGPRSTALAEEYSSFSSEDDCWRKVRIFWINFSLQLLNNQVTSSNTEFTSWDLWFEPRCINAE